MEWGPDQELPVGPPYLPTVYFGAFPQFNGYEGDLYVSPQPTVANPDRERKYIKVRGEWHMISEEEFQTFLDYCPDEVRDLYYKTVTITGRSLGG